MRIHRLSLTLCIALCAGHLAADTPQPSGERTENPMPENVFQDKDMTGASFERVNLADVRFHNANLSNAVFDDINLGGASFFNVNLSNVKIGGANIQGLTIFGFNVEDLINAEMDRRDPAGAPARRIKRATHRGDVATIRELLDANPSLAITETDGWTPFQDAAWHGKAEIVALMVEKVGDIPAAEIEGALHHAVQMPFGNLETVEAIIGSGKVAPIFAAVYRNDLDGMRNLLNSDTELVHAQDAALLRAAENGQKEMVELLLEHGADIRATGRGGASALHLCAWNWVKEENRSATLRFLLERGAEADARADDGATPLFRAASVGLRESCAILLEFGADIHAKNPEGKTVLALALESGNKDMETFLREHGATE